MLLGLFGSPRRAAAAPLPPPTTSLDRLAVSLAGRLSPALEGRRIPAIRLLLQVRLPEGHYATGLAQLARLAARLTQSRLEALGLRRVVLAPASLPEERLLRRARRQGFDLALRTELAESGGAIHLRARLYAVRRPLWERLQPRPPRLLTVLHASAPVDAAVRAYLAAPSHPATVSCRGAWFPLDRQRYHAAALGDVDGDGRTEIVLASEQHLRVLRWAPVYRRFHVVARTTLPGALAPIRPRLPMVSLLVADLNGDRRADLWVRSSRRAVATALTLRPKGGFRVLRRLDGYPVGLLRSGPGTHLAVLLATPGKGELKGRTLRFLPPLARPSRLRLPRRLLRAVTLPPTRSVPAPRVATLEPDGRLRVRVLSTGATAAAVGPVGVAFAFGDLTGDGRLEWVTTSANPLGEQDALTVRRMPGGAPLCSVRDLPGAVTAVAVGDARLRGRVDVVAVVWNPATRRSYLLVMR